MRPILGLIVGVLTTAAAIHGETASRFDVASIKLNTGGTFAGGQIGLQPGGRWSMTNMPVSSLIYSAYPTLTNELVDAPDWVGAERYDVNAKTATPPTKTELESLLQALLVDRFAFRGRIETVERPVYSLVSARADGHLGPAIRRFDGDCAGHTAAVQRGETPPALPAPTNGAKPCQMVFGGDRILAGGIAMDMLAANISQAAGRVVMDRTMLPGVYEFTLRYSMRPGPTTGTPDDPPSIFVAVQEQLGLKLEPARGQVERVVVEHIERPTAD